MSSGNCSVDRAPVHGKKFKRPSAAIVQFIERLSMTNCKKYLRAIASTNSSIDRAPFYGKLKKIQEPWPAAIA
jgi:hypothetical protein